MSVCNVIGILPFTRPINALPDAPLWLPTGWAPPDKKMGGLGYAQARLFFITVISNKVFYIGIKAAVTVVRSMAQGKIQIKT